MSAILGCVHFDGAPVDPQAFQSALSALDHYGRHGRSSRLFEGGAFGHQRLDVTAAAAFESQPIDADGLVLVADAILDNRETLCDQLGVERPCRTTLPDSQLILLAYRRWGRDCVRRLVGDFAFALWDARDRSLLCARDHVGARPLYVLRQGQRFFFASDQRAFRAWPGLSLGIDESSVAAFLLSPGDCHDISFFRDACPLTPGRVLRVDRQGETLDTHWSPEEAASVRYPRRADYVDHFRELLIRAVGDRLGVAGEVGAHLSGGLDSSGVTVLASQLLRGQGRRLDSGYSWSPPVSSRYPLPGAGRRDEREVIERICRQEGLECHYGATKGADFLAYLERDIALDGTVDVFEELGAMRVAEERGVRVMLSGWGGDESATFGIRGYPGYLLTRGRWIRLLSLAREAAGGLRRPRNMARFVWEQSVLPCLPDTLFARFSPYRHAGQVAALLRPEWRKHFPEAESRRGPAWRLYPDSRRMQCLLFHHGHLGSRMSTWAHWSATHGLIYRYPLTDRRLLDFTLGLPPDLLWEQGRARQLYRDAIGQRLPPGLGKNDNANERKRMAIREECWRLLASASRRQAFQLPCEWLDMAAFQARLRQPPAAAMTIRDLPDFMSLCSAVQAWHLWRRYMSAG
ncbi:asparagine synthetase B family protein [Halomonas mongoliensis]|uniref:asparagine synthetase B family protein n=1 Tax=Halomonas mongoliensis TaxID=321265 RepID=UPI00403AFF53